MTTATTPPAGLPAPGTPPAAERDDRPDRRRPLPLWDRVKFLVAAAALFGFLTWNTVVDIPIITFADAVRRTAAEHGWILWLGAAEAVRQLHYLISERSAAWHRLWAYGVFGRFERLGSRLDPWNRYRIARALKVVAALVATSIVLGAVFNEPFTTALITLPARLVGALPFILQLAFAFFFITFQFIGLFWFLSRGGTEVYFPDDISTRFSDVWGQDAVVAKVSENLLFLEDPDAIEAKGGYVPGGILLWGPPGTGKTLMAEAVAGETGKPFVFVEPGAFINMFFGVGILKVKALFRKLRKLALRYGGVVVFFDEADALGNRGNLAAGGLPQPAHAPWHPAASAEGCGGWAYLSDAARWELWRAERAAAVPPEPSPGGLVSRFVMGAGMGGGGMGTLQALLTELSGLNKPRGFINRVVRRALGMKPKPPPKYRILVMMATNMPAALDEALLRPGRIDRIYKVGYPSKDGRRRTFEGYLAKVPHRLTPAEIDKLATITPYATGASIKDMVNEALINAIRAGREEITWEDIIRAKQLKEHGPPDDHEYIERERHAVAVHEACHAVVAHHTRRHAVIDVATIERRGDVGGFVASIPPEDRFTHWRSEYEADLMTSLASLAGERLFFDGDNSSGVGGDLRSATNLAVLMEGYWGMGQTVASHGVTRELGVGGGAPRRGDDRPEQDLLEGSLGARVEANLARLLEATRRLLADHRHEVLAVAHALERHRSITGDDVAAIIEGRRGPLVDGRPYHAPGAAELLERYHAAAVEAHRRAAPVALPLPELPEVPTAGELAPELASFAPPAPVVAPPAGNGDHPDGDRPGTPPAG